MPTVTFGTGQSVEFKNAPTQQDIEEVATKLGINKPSLEHGAVKIQQLQEELGKAQQESNRGLLGRVARELPKETAKVLLQTPARFVASGALSPIDITRGLMGQKPIQANIPLLGQTFQGAAQARLDTGEEMPILGKSTPLKEIARAAVEVPLAGLETLGMTQIIKKGAGILGKALQAKKEAKRAEILAIPINKVYKLAPEERTRYFQDKINKMTDYFENRKEEILSNINTNQQTKENLIKKINEEYNNDYRSIQKLHDNVFAQSKIRAEQISTNLLKQGEELQTKVHQASTQTALNLREPAKKLLGEQSAQYRKLVENEMSTYADTPINADQLRVYIQKTSSTPEEAISKIDMMKIPESGQSTLGKLYQKTLELGQEIGIAAKKGTRVYNPDEVMVDKTIHSLVDFMKTQGVDLSEARNFWRNWAPMRNEIMRIVKPFNVLGTETQFFANKITAVSEGTKSAGINNANFIKIFEDYLGESVTGKTKNALSVLDKNKQKILVAKVQSELEKDALLSSKQLAREEIKIRTQLKKEKLLSIQGLKQKKDLMKLEELKREQEIAKRGLVQKRSEMNQKARRRLIIKRIFKYYLLPAIITEETLRRLLR